MNRTLTNNSDARKEIPLYRGCRAYFPAALALIAANSKKGNDKHNKLADGSPNPVLHHSRGKSADHPDCVERHMTDIGDLLALYERVPLEGEPADDWENQLREELGQFGWRALAWIQELAEKHLGAPLAPAAVEPDKHYGVSHVALVPDESLPDPLCKVDLRPKRQVPLHQQVGGACECGDPKCDWSLKFPREHKPESI